MPAALHRFWPPSLLPWPLVLAAKLFEWAIDGGDLTRGNARIACRRVQLLVAEQGLDVTNVEPTLEQMRCEGMPLMPSSA
jgi:hypothetical protein